MSAPAHRQIPVQLVSQSVATTEGELHVLDLDDKMRLRNAARQAGILFGIGTACLVLPLIHYILPPVLWISSVVIFVRRLGDRTRLLGGGGPCPRCGARVDVTPQLFVLPIETFCDQCRWAVRIEAIAPGRATSKPD